MSTAEFASRGIGESPWSRNILGHMVGEFGATDALLRPRRERPRHRRAAEQRDEFSAFHSITSSARASSVMKSRWSDAYCYVAGCGVDCHAMNFQPFGVCVQALRNTSLKLRGWPLISASIAARPVTSAVSPARRTLRSLQVALLYFVLPERREASHVVLVSVSPEEWV